METFAVKLVVAILPLFVLVSWVNLSTPRLRRRAQAVCLGHRTRNAMARALAVGILFR
jgi:hypothetical protein